MRTNTLIDWLFLNAMAAVFELWTKLSELSYMYVLGGSMFPLSTIFLLDCRVWYVLFYYYINNRP